MQIYGHGKQTRSFQYVSDLVDGLVRLMNSTFSQPVNLGNPIERTIDGESMAPTIGLSLIFFLFQVIHFLLLVYLSVLSCNSHFMIFFRFFRFF